MVGRQVIKEFSEKLLVEVPDVAGCHGKRAIIYMKAHNKECSMPRFFIRSRVIINDCPIVCITIERIIARYTLQVCVL